MALVAYGAQDAYMTGDPQANFFKLKYRRHTYFATEGNTYVEPYFEPVEYVALNKNFIKELIAAGLYEQVYTDNKFKVIKIMFDIETCDICMDKPQCVKTSCGHKYCHSCFITAHVEKKNMCSFCRQDIGHEIFLCEKLCEKSHKDSNSNLESKTELDETSESNTDSEVSEFDSEKIKDIIYNRYLNNDNGESDNGSDGESDYSDPEYHDEFANF